MYSNPAGSLLQVNHSHHSHLRSELIKKELSETTQQTCPETRLKTPASPPPSNFSLASDRESQVISSIKAAGSRVKMELQALIEDYKDSAQKLMLNHGYDPQKEAAIREQLGRLQHQKKQRREKFERDLARLQAKKIALSQYPPKNQEERQERKKSIEARIQRIKEREQHRREEQVKFMKFYEQYKAQKPKYQIMEEQFSSKLQQEKNQKLRALKAKVQQTYKPMNLEELDHFEEQYEATRHQAERQRLQNQLMEKKKAEANEAKLNQLYKGHSHSLVLRELQQRQAKTDEPRQKLKRVRQYSQVVREQYRPTIASTAEDVQEDQSVDTSMTERGRKVFKERFLHGQYLGKKVEVERNPLSHSQQINKGLQYLEFLKHLPKRPKEKKQAAVPPPQRKRTISSVYRVTRQRNPLYQGRRYNSIQFGQEALRDGEGVRRMLTVMRQRKGELELEQKLMKHRYYEDRDQFMAVQKSHNNHLYTGIKQKLTILSQL